MHIAKRLSPVAAFLAAFAMMTGCDSGGGGGGGSADVGDNDAALVVCVGDSITQGYNCDGAPYPSQLSAMTGKKCVNMGSNGACSVDGVGKVGSALGKKPGYVCILFGANDAILGHDPSRVGANIRSMISACKSNKTIPIVGTTPPMIKGHVLFNGAAERINDVIRQVAGEEGVTCVDIYGAFGSGEAYLTSDGLHPNAAGAEVIARCFAGAM